MSAGYSGTPLPQKLGIKPESTVRLVNAPADWDLPPLPPGVTVRRSGPLRADVVLFFTTSYADLTKRIERLGAAVFPDKSLWVAWPKQASGVPTDMTSNSARDVALPLGLVDNKICAISEVWSGMRLVWRLERRTT